MNATGGMMSGIAALALTSLVSAGSTVIDFENLEEDFYGTSFTHEGITYHSINLVSGVFPGGDTFEAEPDENLVIENAAVFWADFPGWGSADNVLTFGNAYINGDNFSIGRLSSVTMDLDAPASAASMEIAYYENGPWGGIVFHLDAIADGAVVDADTITISDLGGRDNVAVDTLSVSADSFDQLHLYATYGSEYSLPRIMIDDIVVQPIDVCAGDIADDDGAGSDGMVNVLDLLEMLAQWGSAGSADIAGPEGPEADGTVNVLDLLEVLRLWGSCP